MTLNEFVQAITKISEKIDLSYSKHMSAKSIELSEQLYNEIKNKHEEQD